MSVAPAPAPALHARRCARHQAREAAARCPQCGEYFCRECVVEHAGRLLCAPCLAKISGAREARRIRLAVLRRRGLTVAGLAALWIVFYGIGALLLKVPAAVHDGTIWQRLSDRATP